MVKSLYPIATQKSKRTGQLKKHENNLLLKNDPIICYDFIPLHLNI